MNNLIFFSGILVIIIFYISPGTAIVGGHKAQAPPPDDPVVFVNRRGKSARILGTRDPKRYSFKGLRYAQSPTGPLRFQRPKMYTLEGDITATKYGPPCPQPTPGTQGNSSYKIIGNEDCLFLNVFTPDLPDGSDGLPVAVFIHGGGFRVGAATQYDAKFLTSKKLVMVTIQYRLGSLGFLSTGKGEQPGNAGMFDIALALRWVRDYIHFFGGNPRQVIVMGQGSGGSVAVLVGMSDMTKGYAQGVVAMSGTPVSHWTLDKEPAKTARSLIVARTCQNGNDVEMVKCMQNKTTEEILQSDSDLEEERLNDQDVSMQMAGLHSTGPVSEGEYDYRGLPTFVPRNPLDTMQTGKFNKIPILTGVTKDETAASVSSNKRINMREKIQQNVDYLKKNVVANLQSFTSVLKNGLIPSLGDVTNIAGDVQKNVGGTLNKLSGGKLPQTGLLRSKRQSLTNIIQSYSPVQFDNYLKIANPGNIQEALGKAIEVTTDALFNFPAFLTASLWSKSGTPTYMYRFEHASKTKKTNQFLKSGPLIADDENNAESSNLVNHGDDLLYLFDPQTIDGEPIDTQNKLTDEDQKVRDVFSDLISDFAHSVGHTQNASRHRRAASSSLLKQFNEKDNNYISISTKSEQKTGFRFCEMALWGGLAERLQSTSCQFLNTLQGAVSGAQNGVRGIQDTVSGGQKNVRGSIPGGSLIGGNNAEVSNVNVRPSKIGGLLKFRANDDEESDEQPLRPVRGPNKMFGGW